MRKVILVSNIMATAVLAFYAVKKGLDIALGIALLFSVISNALNIYYEVRYEREKED